MSPCAITSETYRDASWVYSEIDDDDDEELHEKDEAELVRGEEELGLLLAGMNELFVSRVR